MTWITNRCSLHWYVRGAMFSKACMYAIRAAVLMASDQGTQKRWTLGMIVDETGAPEAFMAKILQKLVHAGLLRSVKGPGGGFDIDPKRIPSLRLGEVVMAIDGDALFKGCALGFPKCDEKRPCPIHAQVAQVRERLQSVVGSTLIRDLGKELDDGTAFLRGKS